MPHRPRDEAPASPERWEDAESADSASELLEGPRGGSFLGRHGTVLSRALAVCLAGAAVGACAVAFSGGAASAAPPRADVGASTGLAAVAAGSTYGNFLETAAPDAATAPPSAVTQPTTAPVLGSALVPAEDRDDGNVCANDEEPVKGLCYKKCSILTNEEYPIRTSAWTCCQSRPCGITNQRMSPSLPCTGYDVSGDDEGRGCPHAPGACLADEEFSLGMCYKKCSILTGGQKPYRVAAATCCEEEGINCFEHFWHSQTSKTFNVGGGRNDGDASTPRHPHLPMEELTEIATD